MIGEVSGGAGGDLFLEARMMVIFWRDDLKDYVGTFEISFRSGFTSK